MNILGRYILMLFALLCLWQTMVSYWNLPSYLLPTPWQVLMTFQDHFSLLMLHTFPTLIEMLIGFLLGILFGCVVGSLLAFFRPFSFLFLPLVIISQAIPTFAIAPLLVMWLGFGITSKIAVALLMTFFPVTSALYDGLRHTPAGWLDLAQTMNGQAWRIFCFIRVPAALPSLTSGMRIAAVSAPIGAVVGEWVGSSHGLGYLMLNANARLQIDVMFAALLIIMILALALYFCVDKLLRILVTW